MQSMTQVNKYLLPHHKAVISSEGVIISYVLINFICVIWNDNSTNLRAAGTIKQTIQNKMKKVMIN